jgi:hypothetical protein
MFLLTDYQLARVAALYELQSRNLWADLASLCYGATNDSVNGEVWTQNNSKGIM